MVTKILHVRASNFFGGPEKQIVEHIQETRSADRIFYVGSFKEPEGNAFLDMSAKYGIQTCEFGSGFFAALRDIAATIQREKFDIVCSHDYKGAILLNVLRLRLRFRFIAFVRGRTKENWRISMYQAIEDQVVRFADAVVAVSNSEAKRLQARWMFRKGPLPIVVHNAVRRFDHVSDRRCDAASDLRSELGIPESTFMFVVAGRLSPEKGHGDLIKALEILHRDPDLRQFVVVICGDGVERGALAAQVDDAGLQGHVHFAGHRHDVPRFLASMDCMILPSKNEGLPNILLETMAMGKPSLCTRVGGIPELVSHLGEAVLVEPDPMSMANGIRSILRGEFDLGAIGRNASEHVARQFTFAAQGQRLVRLYQNFE